MKTRVVEGETVEEQKGENLREKVRIGKLVTMTIAQQISFTATATAKLSNNTAIPARFRPTNQQYYHIEIQTNSVNTDGLVEVISLGTISIGTAHYGSFTSGQPCSIYPFSISWITA